MNIYIKYTNINICMLNIQMFADPAAPVGNDAQRTQEVDKTPTPPPQDGSKDTPPADPIATGASSESAPGSQASPGGFTIFFEGLKSNFGQSSQSKSEVMGSSREAAASALEGNPSPPPSLTADIEADTDKNSGKPAVQALIEGMSYCTESFLLTAFRYLMMIAADCTALYCFLAC